MDVLHDDTVDGFCLVSSDSDFIRLATRLREEGKVGYGFGQRKTPEPFVPACDKFIYTEILRAEVVTSKPNKAEEAVPALPDLQPMVLAALDAAARDDGWVPLGRVGGQMNKNNSSFDPRNCGSAQLSKLMRKQDYLEVQEVPLGDGSANVHLYIRRRVASGR